MPGERADDADGGEREPDAALAPAAPGGQTAAQARPGTNSTVVGYQAKLAPAPASAHMKKGTAAQDAARIAISPGRNRVRPRIPATARSRTVTVAAKLRTMNAIRMGMSAEVGPW